MSPDLNPIEWIWADMKRFLRKKFVKNLDELKDSIIELQSNIIEKYCQAFINKMKEVF